MYPTVKYLRPLDAWYIDDGSEAGNSSLYDSRESAQEAADSSEYDYCRRENSAQPASPENLKSE
jgi:hypothetical protein